MVFNSWDGTSAHLAQIGHRFDRLWEGKEPDWVAMPIPEAVKQKLLKLRPADAPLKEFGSEDEEPEQQSEETPPVTARVDADQRERIIFQFLRDVPHLLNAHRLGMETCTVRPWPHQTRVADTVVKRFPERFMLCDEVGLGKTIEAGLAIRQLVLSGVVQACARSWFRRAFSCSGRKSCTRNSCSTSRVTTDTYSMTFSAGNCPARHATTPGMHIRSCSLQATWQSDENGSSNF